MSHVDEGLIHAWLEDQLPPDEAQRVEQLVATDAAWRAAAVEARGLIAATARVIGALDSAPSVVAGATARTEWTGRTGRTGSSWARKPWMRVAAAVVLVAGIYGLWLNRDNTAIRTAEPVKDATQKEIPPAAVAESRSVSGQTAATGPAMTPSPRPPQVAQFQARRDSSTANERDAVRNAVAATPPPVAAAAANEVASAAKSVATGTTGATGAADATADARGASGGVAGGGRGAGGRGGLGARVADEGIAPQSAARAELAKTLAVPDSVFSSCWIRIDTAGREARQATESVAPQSMVLRFTQPVVTDLGGARAPTRVSAAPPSQAISALRPAPLLARVQNATAYMKDDSTIVAEWLNPDMRTTTQLTFRTRGDTLRGSTNVIAGALMTAGPAFVAVRALCSR